MQPTRAALASHPGVSNTKRVGTAQGLQGVASGAIASDYQRLRVEAMCSRLGLTSLAYLWHQPQACACMHRLTGSCLTLHHLLLPCRTPLGC
jgi:diphthamide synthase (EF-2-diphthine--ammonia ligase)